jgi:hydrogenase assembly chaperone HypC/HupF
MSGAEQSPQELAQLPFAGVYCEPDAHGHCATCSDEASPVWVVEVNEAEWTAVVELNGQPTEVDISLIEQVVAGQWLLVHAGVAIGRLDAEGRA